MRVLSAGAVSRELLEGRRSSEVARRRVWRSRNDRTSSTSGR
ncbi:hypothetical protein NJ7G_0170 [Natrinema sp. J7-2]|nr:hypothetical protein NJ7G_0170 [Natrinema sp. J7-2]